MAQLLLVWLLLTALSGNVHAQSINVTSTWIAGTSSANSASVKGTVGVPSTTIYMGGRVMPCLAITVADTSYKVYLYGGQGYSGASLSYQKDFWRYNLATSEWTMLTENPSTTAATGTRGTESSTTFPGAFGRSACLINPRDNYLYMFGGVSGPRYNDMWRYNPTSGYWAWLGGGTSTTPTINTESSTIFPSTRRNSAMVAHPTLNILIMMSGFGADLSGATGDMNDMWKFNLDTNAWTWFAGSVNSLTVSNVFDTKGVANSANFPGGRNMHTTWIHPTTYAMYLFGGLTGTGTAYFNDMWSYDFTSGYWKWISGGTANNQVPTQGASGVFDATYTPGARASAIFAKLYGTTYLSLYGGRGYGVNSATYNANLNEMWMFDYSTNQWAWIVGSNEPNTYGTMGFTSSGPYPQGRNLYVCAPLAFQTSVVYFGGLTGTANYMDDMWKLDFSTLTSATSTSVAASSTAASSSLSSAVASSTMSSSSAVPSSSSSSQDPSSSTMASSTAPLTSSSSNVAISTSTDSSIATSTATSSAVPSTSTVSSTVATSSVVSLTSSSAAPTSSSSVISSTAAATSTLTTTALTSSPIASSTDSSSVASSSLMTSTVVLTTSTAASTTPLPSSSATLSSVVSSSASSSAAVTSSSVTSSAIASTSSSVLASSTVSQSATLTSSSSSAAASSTATQATSTGVSSNFNSASSSTSSALAATSTSAVASSSPSASATSSVASVVASSSSSSVLVSTASAAASTSSTRPSSTATTTSVIASSTSSSPVVSPVSSGTISSIRSTSTASSSLPGSSSSSASSSKPVTSSVTSAAMSTVTTGSSSKSSTLASTLASTSTKGTTSSSSATRSTTITTAPINTAIVAGTSTKLTAITAASSSDSSLASPTPDGSASPGSGDAAALTGLDNIGTVFAQPGIIAALVAVVIIIGVIAIKLRQRCVRRSKANGKGSVDKYAASMNYVVGANGSVQLQPDTILMEGAGGSSDYVQVPTETSMHLGSDPPYAPAVPTVLTFSDYGDDRV